MMYGFKYCNGRPCKFHISEEEISQGYLHEWMYVPEDQAPYGIVEDLDGLIWFIEFDYITLLPWDTIFVKEEQPDES